MEEKKTFPRVGARNIRMLGTRTAEISHANGCYCPTCGAGPMDGCTGIYMEVEGSGSDNSFGFNDTSNFFREVPEFNPGPGDPSICCYCGTLVAYDKSEDGTMSLHALSRAEISRIKDNPDLWCGLMQMKDFIDAQIEKQQIKGNKRYAGKCTKSIIA